MLWRTWRGNYQSGLYDKDKMSIFNTTIVFVVYLCFYNGTNKLIELDFNVGLQTGVC